MASDSPSYEHMHTDQSAREARLIRERDELRKDVEFAQEQEDRLRAEAEKLRAELDEPRLGCATTAELLRELQVRAEIHGYADYRTVGEEAEAEEEP